MLGMVRIYTNTDLAGVQTASVRSVGKGSENCWEWLGYTQLLIKLGYRPPQKEVLGRTVMCREWLG